MSTPSLPLSSPISLITMYRIPLAAPQITTGGPSSQPTSLPGSSRPRPCLIPSVNFLVGCCACSILHIYNLTRKTSTSRVHILLHRHILVVGQSVFYKCTTLKPNTTIVVSFIVQPGPFRFCLRRPASGAWWVY